MNKAPAFTTQYDDIPWRVMYAMRNRVSHGYDKVDFQIIWRTIHDDLPNLRLLVQNALANTANI